jgi:hypothetical protein
MTALPSMDAVLRRRGVRARATANGFVSVMCADGLFHRYVSCGVPEYATGSKVLSSCPLCGFAEAELIGTVGIRCHACKSDRVAIDGLRVQFTTGGSLGWRVPEWMEGCKPREIENAYGDAWATALGTVAYAQAVGVRVVRQHALTNSNKTSKLINRGVRRAAEEDAETK